MNDVKTILLFILVGAAATTSGCGLVALNEVLSGDDDATSGGLPSSVVLPITEPPASSPLDSEEMAFVNLINQYRAQHGLKALTVSVTLTQSSDWMSNDMAGRDYFSHSDSHGRSSSTRMRAFGYSSDAGTGENIAAGNSTAQKTFTQWKNSSGHNAIMLGSSYKAMGISRGYAKSSTYGWYWTLDVGSKVDSVLF